jgi:hypothetical protein
VKWTSIANAGDVLTGWKVAKTRPSFGFDAITWKDFVFDREDKFVNSERPLSRGENFEHNISFKHKNSIDADDESNDDFKKNNFYQNLNYNTQRGVKNMPMNLIINRRANKSMILLSVTTKSKMRMAYHLNQIVSAMIMVILPVLTILPNLLRMMIVTM